MTDDFYLFATCNFKPDRYEDWQAAYDDLAEYVYAMEPTTKTYYFGIPMDYADNISATTSMMAFEIYGSRDDLYKTHLSSRPMNTFLSLIPAYTTSDLDLNHYALHGGFLDSSSPAQPPTPASTIQTIHITCTSPTARPKILSHLQTLIDSVTPTAKAEGVLTYMAFGSLDDEVGVQILGRWESRGDMERFVRRRDVGRYWEAVRAGVRSVKQRLWVENGKGWLHRGRQSGFTGEEQGLGGGKARM